MVAVAMGIGTGSLLKDDRPDPWTGSMDAARMSHFEAELKEYIELRVKHLETHVTEASDWKVRIRDLEKTCQLNAERVMQMRRGWRLLDQPGDGE